MPGTIRVSVLEAVDLPLSFEGKDVFIKVYMGPREQVTPTAPGGTNIEPWNANFSFAVQNLQDDLVVAIVDNASQNILAKVGISTPKILEKGFRDEMFALEGVDGSECGNIHLRLSFVLSEEELRKIVEMRQRQAVVAAVDEADSNPSGRADSNPAMAPGSMLAPADAGSAGESTTMPADALSWSALSDLAGQTQSPPSVDSLTAGIRSVVSEKDGAAAASTLGAASSAKRTSVNQSYSSTSESPGLDDPSMPGMEAETNQRAATPAGASKTAGPDGRYSSVAASEEKSPPKHTEFQPTGIQVEEMRRDLSSERSFDQTPTGSTATSETLTKDTETDEAEYSGRDGPNLGLLTKQIIGGVVVLIGLILLWPRKQSPEKRRGFLARLLNLNDRKKPEHRLSDQIQIDDEAAEYFRLAAEGRWKKEAQKIDSSRAMFMGFE